MRNSTSGKQLPIATYSWPVNVQAIGAGGRYSPAPVAVNGARPGDLVIAIPQGSPPAQAAGAGPIFQAYVSGQDLVTLIIHNPGNAVLVALGGALDVDLMCFPKTP